MMAMVERGQVDKFGGFNCYVTAIADPNVTSRLVSEATAGEMQTSWLLFTCKYGHNNNKELHFILRQLLLI